MTTATSKEILIDLAKIAAAQPPPVAPPPVAEPRPAARPAPVAKPAVKHDAKPAAPKKKKGSFDTDGVMVPQF